MDAALVSLEELRRLFFSLIEHLRDTAQRQADLNDQTAKQSTEPPAAQTPEKLGPLTNRQSQLQQIAQPIAAALKQQSEQAAVPPPTQPTGPTDPKTPDSADTATAAETAKTLAQAAELVDAAQTFMSAAAQKLASQTEKFDAAGKPFEDISGQQRQALEKLAEALALLDKSQQPQNQQGEQDQKQNQEQEQSQESQNQESKSPSSQQQNLSANQLLQLIRDREARAATTGSNGHVRRRVAWKRTGERMARIRSRGYRDVAMAVLLLLAAHHDAAAQDIQLERQRGPYYVGQPVRVQIDASRCEPDVQVACRPQGEPPPGVTVQGPQVAQGLTDRGAEIQRARNPQQMG